MELTKTTPVHLIESQDEAMDEFRKQFPLVAGCKVSEDGKVMTYDFTSMSAAHSILADANSIIIANQLPLKARVVSLMKGKEVIGVELRIIYHHIK